MTTPTINIDLDLRAVEPKPLYQRIFGITATWVLLLDIALVLLFGVLSSGVFWSPRAVESMLLSGTQGLLLALGVAILIGAGVFDLSVGANLVLSSVVAAQTIKAISGSPAADGSANNVALALTLGFAAAVVTGALFGLVNGILIAYFDINSLIATLGTTGVGTGLALLIAGGGDVASISRDLQRGFGQASIGFLPLPTTLAIVAALLLALVLRFTRYGTNTLAIGSWRPAAESAGIKVKRHLLSLTALTGVLAGLAGFIDISRYGSTAITSHSTDALAAITAAVIGGTLLQGGKVSIFGTIWGAALAVILLTGLIVIGVPAFYQLMAIGFVLIVAVGIDRYRARRRSR